MDPPQGDWRQAAAGDGLVVSRTCTVSDVSFRAFLRAEEPPHVLWSTPAGLEVVGAGAATRLVATGPDRYDEVREAAAGTFGAVDHDGPAVARPRMFGGLAFEGTHEAADPWSGFPAAAFVLPAAHLTRAEDATYLTVTAAGEDVDPDDVEARLGETRESVASLPAMAPVGERPGVAATRRTTSEAAWRAQVEDAVGRIADGALRKVVLAQALEVDLAGDLVVGDVLERLRRTYPECYRFLVAPTAGKSFFGAPPERLVTQRGRHVATEALAGSVGRGDTPAADAELADSLRDSEKLGHEQRLVVDAICDQLAPLGEVREGERTVRKLATIQHLRTPIEATLSADRHVLSIVEALHPTPAVGGLPPEEARAVIRETETFDRGWYAAPVGWFDADGDGEFAVGIRSAVANGSTATLYAGNGIVTDSDPDEEWAEVQLKYRPILDELER